MNTLVASAAVTFVDSVAERCKLSVDQVENILAKHGVEPTPSPPKARSLSIESVYFKGTKSIGDAHADFEFSWDTSQPGMWALTSTGNLVGKTTVLQVILWALRGVPKNLTATVRKWLHDVRVVVKADDQRLTVAFDCRNDKVVGSVTIEKGMATAAVASFVDDNQFKRTMQKLMLGALELEPIPAFSESRGKASAYEDGWAAYTGAFLTDSNSDAIIGENVGTDLTQRLLQVYVGLPWAQTLFRSRSRQRALEFDAQQRKRQIGALRGRSVEELTKQLEEINLKIQDEEARNKVAEEIKRAKEEFNSWRVKVEVADMEAGAASTQLDAATSAHSRAQRAILNLQEEHAASTFFGKLRPSCCPRCTTLITSERLEAEHTSNRCSVCSTEVVPLDPEAYSMELVQAKERGKSAQLDLDKTKKRAKELDARHKADREAFEKSATRLKALSELGTAADVLVLTQRRERLEGMLELAGDIEQASLVDAEELAILTAATAEASARIEESAGAVLGGVSAEVTRIVQRLGMADVQSVRIKRNAHVEIEKGGSTSNFGQVSVGEQLRLRIATVIALVRCAKERGMGRHPGLLMIDSPGKEEVSEMNLRDMLDELGKLCDEVGGLQMFVAMAHQSDPLPGDPARMRHVKDGELLW